MSVRRPTLSSRVAAGVAITLAAFTARPHAQSLTPYTGSPAPVPGIVQAANFDNGGEGVAYHDWSAGNLGGLYRQTDVDIAASSEGGFLVGWIGAGEWINYTVNVATSGSYTAQIRIASPNGGATLHIGFNHSPGSWTPVSVPATGGWQTWSTINVPLNLTAGVQQMTLAFDTSGYNISYVNVTSATSSGTTPGGALTPFLGSPAAVPGTIQASDFDNGGEGVAYHDTTSGNAGGAYRTSDVDIASSVEGGSTVGWIDAGEWLNYTVNVASSGSYTAQIRVATPASGKSLHIGFNKSAGSWTSVSIPSTGGWQTWSTVNVPLTLTAGVQQMTLLFDTGWYNVSYVKVVSSATAPPAPPPPAPPPPTTGGGRLRMITWNIHEGKDAANNYVLPSQMSLLASQNPDVAVLQEVQTWDEFQPTRIPALMQQATGQTWYSIWVPTPACATGGCLGELILSRIPFAASTTTYLAPSSAGRGLIYIGGVPINILTTHLEYFDTNLRTTQLLAFMAFAQNFGGPRLAGGDFNSWWGEWWILQMVSQYHDTWFDVSHGEDGAYTTGSVRFDYIFRAFDGDWRVTPTNAFVVGTSLSDHRPFVADYTVQ
jgi:endonuclease/exonuclease/phosphatase family metal-dependent hydrolase